MSAARRDELVAALDHPDPERRAQALEELRDLLPDSSAVLADPRKVPDSMPIRGPDGFNRIAWNLMAGFFVLIIGAAALMVLVVAVFLIVDLVT